MPKTDECRYRKYPKDNSLDKWYVFDTHKTETVYLGNFENVSLACHNLNKKYYKELSVTSDNKDCAVPSPAETTPKPSDDGFAQS